MNAACAHGPPLGLAGHERLDVTGAVGVGPAGGAFACRAARYRVDPGKPARVQRTRAGHLDRRAPRAVRLADHERLHVTEAVRVEPAGRAVAAEAHDTDSTLASPPAFSAPEPGTPIAVPQVPFRSLTTNACP